MHPFHSTNLPSTFFTKNLSLPCIFYSHLHCSFDSLFTHSCQTALGIAELRYDHHLISNFVSEQCIQLECYRMHPIFCQFGDFDSCFNQYWFSVDQPVRYSVRNCYVENLFSVCNTQVIPKFWNSSRKHASKFYTAA